MNIDDKEFILQLLDDLEKAADLAEVTVLSEKLARARSILERGFYKETEEKESNPRQEELDFNEGYRDWHSGYDETQDSDPD